MNLRKLETDVLIVGSGITGQYTALNIDPSMRVLLISKEDLRTNNSYLAQGGIAVTFAEEGIDEHIEDTLKAGAYYNTRESVKVLVEEGHSSVEQLIEWGVLFDHKEGSINFTKEGGHSVRRIIHRKDYTGKEIIEKLTTQVMNRNHITCWDNAFLVEVLTDSDQVIGALMLLEDELIFIETSKIVLATGGIGNIYLNSTNASISSGDGIAIAKRAGALIEDMEFIQFHPTPFLSSGKAFLISEAVRGEGGILRNLTGEAFMERYHTLKDLAPRDIVSRAILKEQETQGSEKIYLDVTHFDTGYFEKRFPSIFAYCVDHKINPCRDLIPINPAEHYLMGGITTNLNGETTIKGLYSCGESARTGVQGANRLASNSLSEGLVFGKRVAQAINISPIAEAYIGSMSFEGFTLQEVPFLEDCLKLKKLMDYSANIIRKNCVLADGIKEISELEKKYSKTYHLNRKYFEFKNMLVVSRLILEMALARPESLGGHFLEDCDD
jgi:L-aspartate oxidase